MNRQEVAEAYKAGKTLSQIAVLAGVTRQRIDQILAREKVERRKGTATNPDDVEKIKKLFESGETSKKIAEIMGLKLGTVIRIKNDNGIERVKKPYQCSVCGGFEWRANGAGKVCIPCSAKRARDYYATHGKIERENKAKK